MTGIEAMTDTEMSDSDRVVAWTGTNPSNPSNPGCDVLARHADTTPVAARPNGEVMIVLGLGCDRNTPFSTLAQAIDEALQQCGRAWADVQALASIDLKVDEAAMQDLIRARKIPIRFYTATELATVPVPNPSEVVRKYTGTPSVSEAAALRVAGEWAQQGKQGPLEPLNQKELLEQQELQGQQKSPGQQKLQALQELQELTGLQGQHGAQRQAPAEPAPMSALLIEKHKLRGPDGRNATVSVARLAS